MTTMLRGLICTVSQWLERLNRSLQPRPVATPEPHVLVQSARQYRPLEQVALTDGVCRTLFDEYAAHRATDRGNDETGWVLLGLRDESEAVVLATLPAGRQSEASASHVQFNAMAQAVASRIVRQRDRRLTILGVVHTHPGSLRHPSDGDYRGDSQWVRSLRHGEGIFGIGTADAEPAEGTIIAQQPRPHVQCLGSLRFSWYALKQGDRQYRPLPLALTLGPDLARPLHLVWPVIEAHAEPLERLFRQQAGLNFEVLDHAAKPALIVTLPLAERGHALRMVLYEEEVQYYLLRGGEIARADPPAERVDRAVYLLLAELAAGAA